MSGSIRRFTFLFLIFAVVNLEQGNAQNAPTPPVPAEWLTHAEKTDYRETPTYAETLAYARRLDAASTQIRLTEFGRSGEGRPLPLMIASKDGEQTTPQSARRAGKVIVLVQACIHAGETDGKDAGLALLRDIAVTKTRAALLDRVVLLFIPIFNADGHERRSPFNRINQNGPAEMGWRGNATNLNLNRDYLKADAPETRAWLRMWNEWQPDLFIDCHVTDGADFRYNITYQYEQHENVHPAVVAWSREAFDKRIAPATEAAGNLVSTYLEFRDNRYPEKGIDSFIASPRFSTGYTAVVRNRPGLLIETHMLKEHRWRVRGTYDMLRAALEEVNRDPASLLRAVRQADDESAALGRSFDTQQRVALKVALTDKATPMLLRGFEYRRELSDVSGAVRVIWSDKPLDQTVPFYAEARATVAVAPPLYYIIPPQWTQVVEVLAAHGLRMQRLAEPVTLEVESYRLRDAKFNPTSRGDFATFEGRVLVSFRSEPVRERRTYPAGSVVVPLAQPASRAALHLLEPDAPDSFVAWGFFHPIFEQKEYGEDYVLEKLARDMLAKDERLRAEFEARVASDAKFAASATERLRFFYERSPYWDRQLGLYPVGRVVTPLTARLVNF